MKNINQVGSALHDRCGLYDIRDIRVDKSLPPSERIQKYLDEVEDPYHFMVGDTKVAIRFTGERSLNACVAGALNATLN